VLLPAFAAALLLAPSPRCAASDDQAVLDPTRFEVETFPEEACVHGKYATLLRRIHCPEDLTAYHRFSDYGMYTGTSWHNYNNLPPGYWVYVYPDWYIWRDCKGAPPGKQPPAPVIPGQLGK
jgi:hypothetical protein